MRVSRVYIYSPLGQLYQTHQINNASGARRERDFPCLSETLNPEEDPLSGAYRGVYEELNIWVDRKERFQCQALEPCVEVKPSPTTGEVKRYEFHDYKLELTREEAQIANLLVDEGSDTTYFEWRQYEEVPQIIKDAY